MTGRPDLGRAGPAGRLLRMLLAVSSLSGVAVAGNAALDLRPLLAESEVCPSEVHCWPRETSAALHRAGSSADGRVQLPPGSASNLYVRVAGAAVAELEYMTVGAALVVTARAEGAEPRELYRQEAPSTGWRTVKLDLGPWSGRIVRLGFRPEPRGETPDQRCFVRQLALLNGSAKPARGSPATTGGRRPNVVLYVIDTLRADHLGCYGYTRPTSPRIDAFARSAVVFRDAVAQSSWTLPATASLLTGRTPPHHGALAVGSAVRPEVPTVAERLRTRGYRTAAFVTNTLVSGTFGMERGFGEFHLYAEKAERAVVYLPSSALHRRVQRWLGRASGDQPFFLYVHAADPHWPYLPPPRYARPFRAAGRTGSDERTVVDRSRSYFFGNEHHGERPTTMPASRVAALRDLYDGDVRASDDSFGRLLDELGELRLLDDTIVVLTSDHGEEFLDHDGLGHGQTLHHEVLHVPLLVRLPHGVRGGEQVTRTVQHVDVARTILDLAGDDFDGVDGYSLLANPADGAEGDEVLSYLDHLGITFDGITTPGWRAIRDLAAPPGGRARIAVYDREHDRAEQRDVATEWPVVTGYARQRLRVAATAARPGPAVDPRQLERLRALGYVAE